MAVMMVMLFALDYRDYAPMRRLAHGMFELNRRVVDAEVAQQALLHLAQDAFAD